MGETVGSTGIDDWQLLTNGSEAWRYSGPFKTSILRWKGAFPGLGVATGAFALYLAYDIFLAKDDGGHH